jgi:peptidoglycan/xylan/chitin deacetylase (PgdA/CDA1 family)
MIPRRLRWPAAAGAAAASLQFVPSVASLAQWTPLRALPAGACRWRGPASSKVALTFDDGPAPETVALLDRLDELELQATFFCLGTNVARHPEVVEEMIRRGHQVETHGHRHDHHLGRGPGWIGRDLDEAVDALARCGVEPTWFRPPYGQLAGGTVLAARRRRLRLVLWSAWGREWAEPDAAAVAVRVRRALAPGAIVLLHDADTTSPAGSAERAREALGTIADDLADRGLRAVTLDELVAT